MKTTYSLAWDESWFRNKVETLYGLCNHFHDNEQAHKAVRRVRGNSFSAEDIAIIIAVARDYGKQVASEPGECPYPDMPGRDIAAEWRKNQEQIGRHIHDKADELANAWDELRPMSLEDVRRRLAIADSGHDAELRNQLRMLFGDICEAIDGRWDDPEAEDAA